MVEKITKAIGNIGYQNLGTLEFLLDGEGNYYFMEMNLRLQVEHAVTEAITGIDLVKWQIRIAAGVPLSFSQEDVKLTGSSIECRVSARTPEAVKALHVPGGPFVRFDTYLETGLQISPVYDPLLGKLIVYAETREQALRKMRTALCELVIEGVENNIEEQLENISHPHFQSGNYNLDFFKSEVK